MEEKKNSALNDEMLDEVTGGESDTVEKRCPFCRKGKYTVPRHGPGYGVCTDCSKRFLTRDGEVVDD